jgi:hypothetical protein
VPSSDDELGCIADLGGAARSLTSDLGDHRVRGAEVQGAGAVGKIADLHCVGRGQSDALHVGRSGQLGSVGRRCTPSSCRARREDRAQQPEGPRNSACRCKRHQSTAIHSQRIRCGSYEGRRPVGVRPRPSRVDERGIGLPAASCRFKAPLTCHPPPWSGSAILPACALAGRRSAWRSFGPLTRTRRL